MILLLCLDKFEKRILPILRERLLDHEIWPMGEFIPHIRQSETPERVILRLAKANNGMVTAGEVAIEANIPIEEAQRQLDNLAKKSIAQVRVRSSGVLVYFSPNSQRKIRILSIEGYSNYYHALSVIGPSANRSERNP